MSAYVDTNVLVRHLTGDPPDQATRATALLRRADRLCVPDLVLAETVYVLESYYRVPRAAIAEMARAIVAFPAVLTDDPPRLLRALEVYEVERLDFADAYLVACAERTDDRVVISFDRAIGRMGTVVRVAP